jgi:hypothetical protein
MRVIAYTYEADIHCPSCAKAAHEGGRLTLAGRPTRDLNGLPQHLDDRDCNPVGAVFSTDEIEPNTCCGTCHREIK